jgi:hypothetical protein
VNSFPDLVYDPDIVQTDKEVRSFPLDDLLDPTNAELISRISGTGGVNLKGIVVRIS